MGYTITLSNNQMLITNGASNPNVTVALTSPVVELAGDHIVIHDNSGAIEDRKFYKSDFISIGGQMPENIVDAYDMLAAIQASITSSGGGGGGGSVTVTSSALPAGASTSAKQDAQTAYLLNISQEQLPDSLGPRSYVNSFSVTVSADQPAIQVASPALTNLNSAIKSEDSPASSGDMGASVLGVRQDADVSPVNNDGDYHAFIMNQNGRLKVSAKPGATVATLGSITTSSSSVFMDCARESTATLVVTGTFVGVNVSFEFSLDSTNGIDGNWLAILGCRTNSETIESASGVIATGIAYGWQFVLPGGSTYIRARSTAFTSGSATVTWKPGSFAYDPVARVSTIGTGTAVIGSLASITTSVIPGTTATALGKAEDSPHATADVGIASWGVRSDNQSISTSASGDYSFFGVDQYSNTMVRKYGTQKRTYSSAFSVTLAATATDVIEIIGSATTTVQIVRISINGVQTTAGGVLFNLLRRSTAATAGTSTNQTLVSHEATDAAATAVVKAYTANPTTGTLVGNIRSKRIQIGPSTAVSTGFDFNFGENSKPIVLSGVSQTLCVNIGGATVTGGIIDVEIEFTEV